MTGFGRVEKEHAETFRNGCPDCGCPELHRQPGEHPTYRCDHCGRIQHPRPQQQPEPQRGRR